MFRFNSIVALCSFFFSILFVDWRLGVLVNGLQFVDHYGQLSSDPLPQGAYRSSLELITPESNSFTVDGFKELLFRLSNKGSLKSGRSFPTPYIPTNDPLAIHRTFCRYNKQKLAPGNYTIWISMLQEGAAWFYSKQDRLLQLNVYVP